MFRRELGALESRSVLRSALIGLIEAQIAPLDLERFGGSRVLGLHKRMGSGVQVGGWAVGLQAPVARGRPDPLVHRVTVKFLFSEGGPGHNLGRAAVGQQAHGVAAVAAALLLGGVKDIWVVN